MAVGRIYDGAVAGGGRGRPARSGATNVVIPVVGGVRRQLAQRRRDRAGRGRRRRPRARAARGGAGRRGRGRRRHRDDLLRLEGRHRHVEPASCPGRRDRRRARARQLRRRRRSCASTASRSAARCPTRGGRARARRQLHRGRRDRRAARAARSSSGSPAAPGSGSARTGSVAHHGSGEIFLAFSTAGRRPRAQVGSRAPARSPTRELDPLFAATVEATEEAVLNALWAAPDVDAAARAASCRACRTTRCSSCCARTAGSPPERRRPAPLPPCPENVTPATPASRARRSGVSSSKSAKNPPTRSVSSPIPSHGEQDRLVVRDVVLERRHRVEVDRPDVGAAELVDLAERRQQPRAVAAQLALLVHHAELDREPEDVGEVLQRLGRLAAPGRLAGEPLDLGDLRVGEQVPVPDHLVDDVRLGRVERAARVAQVLRRVEDAVGERAVELVERHEPGRGVELEAGQRLQARGDLVELRHVVLGQRERRLRLAERADASRSCFGRELAADGAPDLVLGLRVRPPAGSARPASRRARRRRSRCAGAGTRDRSRPGWSSARWTLTPSASSVTGA